MEVKPQGQLRQKEGGPSKPAELQLLQLQAPWQDTNCWELLAASEPAWQTVVRLKSQISFYSQSF